MDYQPLKWINVIQTSSATYPMMSTVQETTGVKYTFVSH